MQKKSNPLVHNHAKIDIYKLKPIYTNTQDNKNQHVVRHMQYIQNNHYVNAHMP